ncbi:hypothetical protein, partial [Corynebacterium sp. ES2715-CONJ3]|uniref:hypothetical protein n=1 Tax=Corynebacterium sp. ES2715-CONJ3 TaxID=2974028 RepID=UPI00216A6B3E
MKSPIKLAKKQNNQHTQPTQPPKQAAMPTMRTQLKKQNPLPNPTGQKREKKGPKHQQSQPKTDHANKQLISSVKNQASHTHRPPKTPHHSPTQPNCNQKKQKNNWHTIEFSNNT